MSLRYPAQFPGTPIPAMRAKPAGSSPMSAPTSFTTGPFAGWTIRGELIELQKADMGRKYGQKDRRPLDPPPVLQLRFYRVFNNGTAQQWEHEIDTYTDAIGVGCICHVDLFRSTLNSRPEKINQSLQAPRKTNEMAVSSFTAAYPEEFTSRSFRTLPPLSFPTLMSGTDSRPWATSSGARPTLFDSSNPRACSLLMPVSMPPTTILPFPGPSSNTRTVAMFSDFVDSSVSHAKAQVAVSDDDQNVEGASTYTTLLVGTRAVSASCVYHEGKKILAFVFSDLAVRAEGSFFMRYRVFDIMSAVTGGTQHPALAEAFGGTFQVYSTKNFPGLQASTDLTKSLSWHGLRVNKRETEPERKRKKI